MTRNKQFFFGFVVMGGLVISGCGKEAVPRSGNQEDLRFEVSASQAMLEDPNRLNEHGAKVFTPGNPFKTPLILVHIANESPMKLDDIDLTVNVVGPMSHLYKTGLKFVHYESWTPWERKTVSIEEIAKSVTSLKVTMSLRQSGRPRSFECEYKARQEGEAIILSPTVTVEK